MDLSTSYLGLSLKNPLMPGACPIVDDLDQVKRYEDAGAPAIVMYSLFEEQILEEERATNEAFEEPAETSAEALSYFPSPSDFKIGPHRYLEQIRTIKESVSIPVIASLNGTTQGGWLDYAKLIEEAGADALELNVYAISADPSESAEQVEHRTLDMVQQVKGDLRIPVAVKLSPFYTSLAHFAARLNEVGADGLVLFNRFYQPDIDIDDLEVNPHLRLSRSSELLLRLRWIAILAAHKKASIAASGGVHTTEDVIKALMVGADVVQMVSALLAAGPSAGPSKLRQIREDLELWLEEQEYESVAHMRGNMSLARSPDPKAYERANYIHLLHSWAPPLPRTP